MANYDAAKLHFMACKYISPNGVNMFHVYVINTYVKKICERLLQYLDRSLRNFRYTF